MNDSRPSNRVVFIQKYALVIFLAAAFLISWVFWFIEPLLRASDPLTATFLVQLGTYGPVLAAMLISFLSNTKKAQSSVWQGLLAGGLVLVIAVFSNWQIAQSINTDSFVIIHWILLVILVLLPAWIFFNTWSRQENLNDLLNSLTRWKINPLWYMVSIFLMFFIGAIGVLLTSLLTRQPLSGWIENFQSSPILPNLALVFFATALYGGPVGEETGWRGFALPRLQKRFDPLLASVILGTIWAVWHLPLHLSGYYNQVFGSPLNGILMRALSTIPLAIIFTWLYNRTRGNLLVMVLLHTAVNITSALLISGIGLYITTALAVILMVIFDHMYRKSELQISRE